MLEQGDNKAYKCPCQNFLFHFYVIWNIYICPKLHDTIAHTQKKRTKKSDAFILNLSIWFLQRISQLDIFELSICIATGFWMIIFSKQKIVCSLCNINDIVQDSCIQIWHQGLHQNFRRVDIFQCTLLYLNCTEVHLQNLLMKHGGI